MKLTLSTLVTADLDVESRVDVTPAKRRMIEQAIQDRIDWRALAHEIGEIVGSTVTANVSARASVVPKTD